MFATNHRQKIGLPGSVYHFAGNNHNQPIQEYSGNWFRQKMLSTTASLSRWWFQKDWTTSRTLDMFSGKPASWRKLKSTSTDLIEPHSVTHRIRHIKRHDSSMNSIPDEGWRRRPSPAFLALLRDLWMILCPQNYALPIFLLFFLRSITDTLSWILKGTVSTIPSIGMIDLALLVLFLLPSLSCWSNINAILGSSRSRLSQGWVGLSIIYCGNDRPFHLWLWCRVAQQAAFDSRTTGSHHFYSC